MDSIGLLTKGRSVTKCDDFVPTPSEERNQCRREERHCISSDVAVHDVILVSNDVYEDNIFFFTPIFRESTVSYLFFTVLLFMRSRSQSSAGDILHVPPRHQRLATQPILWLD